MNEVNFYEIFRPIQRYSRVLGLTCFTIKKRRNTFQVVINHCDLFLLFLSLWWHFSVSLVIYFKPTSVIEMKIEILSTLYNSSLMKIFLCFSFLVMFLNVWFMIVRKKFVGILNLMSLIDNQLTKLYVLVNYQRQKCVVILFIIFMNFATFLFLLGEFVHAKYVSFFDFKAPACVFAYIEIQGYVLLNFQVFFLIWSVKVRYNAINKFLMTNFSSERPGFCDGRKQIKFLNETGLIHDHLVDVTNLINDCYGLPIMFCLTLKFAYIILSLFSIDNIIQASGAVYILTIVMTLSWSMFYFSMPIAIIIMGHLVKKESKRTASIFHQIINTQENEEIIKKLMEMSQQILHRFSNFSSGLFSYDLTLIHSLVSSATMYLIILIQFKTSSNESLQYETLNITSATFSN